MSSDWNNKRSKIERKTTISKGWNYIDDTERVIYKDYGPINKLPAATIKIAAFDLVINRVYPFYCMI